MSAETRPWPLDFPALQKGSWIGTEELERATRKKRDDHNFRLHVLRISKLITDHTGILVRCEGDRLRLMTDSEAYQWNVTQALRSEERLTTCAKRTLMVDRTQLTEADQAAHDSSSRAIQAIAASARKERRRGAEFLQLLGKPVPEIDSA